MNPFRSLLTPSNRGVALALLRVLIAAHIIRKLLLLWPYSDALFGPSSFTEWAQSLYGLVPDSFMLAHYKLVIVTCIIAALAMLFGAGRRLPIIVVFVCVMLIQETNGWILNGGDNLLRFILLYLCFADSFSIFCVGRLTKPEFWISPKINNLWTNIASFCLIAHLCMVYFLSGIAKASAPTWYHGTALYYILQLNRFSQFNLSGWLPSHLLLLCIAGYTVMIWEVTFAALVFVPKFRTPVLCFGVMMHLGIFLFMMIRDFEIVFIMLYVMFYSDLELNRVWKTVSGFSARVPKFMILSPKEEVQPQ